MQLFVLTGTPKHAILLMSTQHNKTLAQGVSCQKTDTLDKMIGGYDTLEGH